MLLRYEVPEHTKRTIRELGISARGIKGALLQSAKETAEILAAEVQKGLSGDRLHPRSGALRRGTRGRASIAGDRVEIGVGVTKGPPTAYAELQERGGTVRAKPGRALPVPLGPVRRRWAVPKSPSELPGNIKLFMLKRPGKDPLLARKMKRGPLQFWYVLKREVTIPSSGWLSGPVEEKAPQLVPRMVTVAMDRNLKRLGGR